jgi:iron complex outermembrane receptor protein
LNTTTLLSSKWDLIAALRVDYHDRINDLAVSPRLGTIFRPAPTHALRLTWNRAFNSPSAPEIFIDMPMGSIMPGMDIRMVGFPKDGFVFSRSCDGRLCMRSPLHPSGSTAALPPDATLLWPALVQILSGAGIDLSGLPAPNASQISTDLRAIDLRQGGFSVSMDESELTQTRALTRILSNTMELGYKGWLGQRAYLAVDVYRIHMNNFYGETVALNPNVFLNQGELQAYLENVGGLAPADAAAIAAAAAGIPLGTIVPDDHPTADVILVNHLGGSYTNWGADLTAELSLSSKVTLSGYYSWFDKNVIFMPGIGEQILSVPRNKGLLGLTYRDIRSGLDGSIQGRAVESFPVASGVLSGQIGSYTVLDVGLGYRISWVPEIRLSFDAWNVLDNRHREWAGAPELGRLVVTRLQVNF